MKKRLDRSNTTIAKAGRKISLLSPSFRGNYHARNMSGTFLNFMELYQIVELAT